MMRCIMFVMPVASDTHRHSHCCPFRPGRGPGMENARDSGEKASADLWEIRSRSMVSRTCTLSMSGSEWPLSQRIDYLLYAGKSMKEGGYEDREVGAGVGGLVAAAGRKAAWIWPPDRDGRWQFNALKSDSFLFSWWTHRLRLVQT